MFLLEFTIILCMIWIEMQIMGRLIFLIYMHYLDNKYLFFTMKQQVCFVILFLYHFFVCVLLSLQSCSIWTLCMCFLVMSWGKIQLKWF